MISKVTTISLLNKNLDYEVITLGYICNKITGTVYYSKGREIVPYAKIL